MRLSKRFKLGKTQFELDFVDIDTDKDLRVFLDPHFLANRSDPWSIDASRTIRSFFRHFLTLLRSGKEAEARELFSHLNEPNETCLGMSKGRPKGRGIGDEFADRLFESLKGSNAVASGLVKDLEDSQIFIRGIGKDLTSDMTTNIIRGHLLSYTEAQCKLWGIDLTSGVASGWIWDRNQLAWTSGYVPRLVVGQQPLLLVPKAVVSYVKQYSGKKYHQHFILPYLQHEHLRMNSVLVKTRKNRYAERYVTKKDIVEAEAKFSKEYLAKFTQQHPEVFANFRRDVTTRLVSLSDNDLTKADRDAVIEHLISALKTITTGGQDATRYHRTVVGILELLFYPDLMSPQIEQEIHEGRKRVDITFDNAATGGFFWRLHKKVGIPCAYIFVECKNYSREVANPELDQLAGRFSVNRGKFGLLLCRSIDDMDHFLQRCADTHKDGRGTILPLVDEDLIQMLISLQSGDARPWETFLTDRLREVVLAR